MENKNGCNDMAAPDKGFGIVTAKVNGFILAGPKDNGIDTTAPSSVDHNDTRKDDLIDNNQKDSQNKKVLINNKDDLSSDSENED